MNKLEENRAVINEVDQELTKLFERRFQAVKEIAQYKMEHHLRVLDRSREALLIQQREAELPDSLKSYFRTWYEGLLAVSRQFQSDLTDRQE